MPEIPCRNTIVPTIPIVVVIVVPIVVIVISIVHVVCHLSDDMGNHILQLLRNDGSDVGTINELSYSPKVLVVNPLAQAMDTPKVTLLLARPQYHPLNRPWIPADDPP
ncbi:hypothetical protein Tco_0746680 [Tanacetum coccineum]